MYGVFGSPITLCFEWFSSTIRKMCRTSPALCQPWSLPCRPVAPASCTVTSAAIAAAVIAASAVSFFIPPPVIRLTSRRSRGGGYTAPLEAARPGGAEQAARFGLDEAHPLVHRLERRLAGAARLLGAHREQALQLALVGAQLAIALLDRREQRDDRLADVLLELAVARAVIAPLELGDRLARGDGHDLEQVRDARFSLRVVADLLLRVSHRGLELLADRVGLV